MSHRTIPIHPARPAPSAEPPRLLGEAARLQQVVGELVRVLDIEVGLRAPTEFWLRELRLADDEAELSLAHNLPHCGAELAQAAFDTLRRLLPDTDIYVRTVAP